MRQYLDAKRQYRDAIVFFRMGDFYEMFYEDALTAARALDITLTSRSKDAGGGAIPMCGVPHHAADTYLTRLVQKGFRVAICEQVEDPKKAKGVVRREVVRVVSPGTFIETSYLEDREADLSDGARGAAWGRDRASGRHVRPCPIWDGAPRRIDRGVYGHRIPRPHGPAGAGRRCRHAPDLGRS